MYTIIVLAGVEALVLLGVGVYDFIALRRWVKNPPPPKVVPSHPDHPK
jgi:hypothetical protein